MVPEHREFETVEYVLEDGVAIITLNRPRKFNAINRQMLIDLAEVVKIAEEADHIKVLVITGARRAFCYGADLADIKSSADNKEESERLFKELLPLLQGFVLSLQEMKKPVIAAINGFATGAGLDLALACDIRIASEKAVMSEAFVKVGLVPDGGGTFFLPRLVGLGKACELIFTGDGLTAQEAEAIGLVNKVVPHDELGTVVRELARKLAKGPSVAIGIAKEAIYHDLNCGLRSALENEAKAQLICVQTDDFIEGIQSASEKRDPKFEGR